MDNITKTTQNAFVSYYNSLRRLGNISKQDKYKLLVLWFFYYLKYKSDYLYKPEEFEINADGQKVVKKWSIDRELEHCLNSKFMNAINCLSNNSCFINLTRVEECTPLVEVFWQYAEPSDDGTYTFLVTNATNPLNFNKFSGSIEDILEQMSNSMWTNGSAFIQTNSEEDNKLMTINK